METLESLIEKGDWERAQKVIDIIKDVFADIPAMQMPPLTEESGCHHVAGDSLSQLPEDPSKRHLYLVPSIELDVE